MKYALFLSLACLLNASQGQWQELDIPVSTRYDDVFFIDENVGWAAGGSTRRIYKTTDGGNSWVSKFIVSSYLRSIEFATPSLGFAGTLNGEFYTSTDAGENWTDISGDLPPFAVNDLLLLPNNDDQVIFAASDAGVYFTANAGIGSKIRSW